MLNELLESSISVISGFAAMMIIFELFVFGIYKAFMLLNITNS